MDFDEMVASGLIDMIEGDTPLSSRWVSLPHESERCVELWRGLR